MVMAGKAGLGNFAAFALAFSLFWSGRGHSQQPARDVQIKELQKQIDALSKKLDELRKAPATPAVTPEPSLNADWIKALTWRSIGPAAMGGRITALAVYEADPCLYWVATASGGLLKTKNNG